MLQLPSSFKPCIQEGSFRGDDNFHCIWAMLALAILQGQVNLSMEKIHPIIPSAIFAGYSAIRLLSFWNASGKAQKLYRENV
jgi:hypothetical protein